MGQRPLTWQLTLIVFCVIGLLPAFVFAWGENIPDEYRLPGQIAFFALLAAIIGLSIGHYRSAQRKDLQPDVLAQLFPPAQVLQAGPSHFVVFARQVDRSVRVVVVVQNLRDGTAHFSLGFSPEVRRTLRIARSNDVLVNPPARFNCTLLPASLVLATATFQLADVLSAGEVRLWITAKASAKGQAVRFARRTAATKRTSGALAALGLFVGVFYSGGGTFVRFEFVPNDASPAGQDLGEPWTALTLWTPEHPAPIEDLAADIRNAF